MPYEHCLIFGAREYFWDDATFHDDCIGIFIDERDLCETPHPNKSPQSKVVSRTTSTQTEPWAPPEAAAKAGTKRKGRPKSGRCRPNPKFRPSPVNG